MKLSILLPVYNRLCYTRLVIPALLENTDVTFELIIVDNGSMPDTVDYLKSMEADPRVKIFYNWQNVGVARALALGLWLVEGEYVCYTGNDLIPPKGWTSLLIDAFENLESRNIGWLNPVLKGALPYGETSTFSLGKYMYREARNVSMACGITNRGILEEIGGFRGSRYVYGGIEAGTVVQLRRHGYLVCWLEDVEVVHLERDDPQFAAYKKWKMRIQNAIRGGQREIIAPFHWEDHYAT